MPAKPILFNGAKISTPAGFKRVTRGFKRKTFHYWSYDDGVFKTYGDGAPELIGKKIDPKDNFVVRRIVKRAKSKGARK